MTYNPIYNPMRDTDSEAWRIVYAMEARGKHVTPIDDDRDGGLVVEVRFPNVPGRVRQLWIDHETGEVFNEETWDE